jgi:hypothetical protein
LNLRLTTPSQPQLLELYERFYLPLEDGLRPVIKALILALLPGLEEETGEFFERVSVDPADAAGLEIARLSPCRPPLPPGIS